jgi:demethylmenaquinone methyltransferase/2-methoxy-6-polyprenyl-1,4-benzoquinol methylase
MILTCTVTTSRVLLGPSWHDAAAVNHEFVAPFYDLLAAAWTGGAIQAAKSFAPGHVSPGDRVLFAGVGGGKDAAVATGRGAEVVGVDLSTRMLTRAARIAGEGFRPLQQDVRDHHAGDYDLVCAHYFLNVFGPDSMPPMLQHLATLVKPGGSLSIADFAPGGGWLRALHYRLPATTFRLLGLCEDHPIYDYRPLLEVEGFSVVEQDFAVFGVGPRWHRTWVGTRD